MPVLPVDTLRDAATRLLCALGAHAEEAERVAVHLVRADLRGVSTHGVQSISMYAEFIRDGHIVPGATPSLAEEGPSTALVDGHHGFGQVVGMFATEIAIAKARATGVGLVGVCHCNHVGALADYTERVAECGMLGVMVANTAAIVAPAGGATAQLGTRSPGPRRVAVVRARRRANGTLRPRAREDRSDLLLGKHRIARKSLPGVDSGSMLHFSRRCATIFLEM